MFARIRARFKRLMSSNAPQSELKSLSSNAPGSEQKQITQTVSLSNPSQQQSTPLPQTEVKREVKSELNERIYFPHTARRPSLVLVSNEYHEIDYLNSLGNGSYGTVYPLEKFKKTHHHDLSDIPQQSMQIQDNTLGPVVVKKMLCHEFAREIALEDCEKFKKSRGWKDGEHAAELDEYYQRKYKKIIEECVKGLMLEAEMNKFIYGIGTVEFYPNASNVSVAVLTMKDHQMKSLRDVKSTFKTFREFLDVYICALQALKELHEVYKVVHGDPSRGNILVEYEKEKSGTIKVSKAALCDLFFTRKIGETTAGLRGGSWYLAPELSSKIPAHPSQDIYSMGKLFNYVHNIGEHGNEGCLPYSSEERASIEYKKFINLLAQMANQDPRKRPPLSVVMETCIQIRDSYKKEISMSSSSLILQKTSNEKTAESSIKENKVEDKLSIPENIKYEEWALLYIKMNSIKESYCVGSTEEQKNVSRILYHYRQVIQDLCFFSDVPSSKAAAIYHKMTEALKRADDCTWSNSERFNALFVVLKEINNMFSHGNKGVLFHDPFVPKKPKALDEAMKEMEEVANKKEPILASSFSHC